MINDFIKILCFDKFVIFRDALEMKIILYHLILHHLFKII